MPLEAHNAEAVDCFSSKPPDVPVKMCDGSPDHEPSRVVHALPDGVVEHPQAAYGFVPHPASALALATAGIDWTDAAQAATARAARLDKHAWLAERDAWMQSLRTQASDAEIDRLAQDVGRKARLTLLAPADMPAAIARGAADAAESDPHAHPTVAAGLDVLTGIAVPKRHAR